MVTATECKGCSTCLYLATREKCDGCLGPVGVSRFLYLNWTPGDGIARVRDFERRGLRNIVIGWQGEAEVNVNDSPAATRAHLVNVAEQCGYLIDCFTSDQEHKAVLRCHLSHGTFDLVWAGHMMPDGQTFQSTHLERIDHIRRDGQRVAIWTFAE